jgi:hypothetical protein
VDKAVQHLFNLNYMFIKLAICLTVDISQVIGKEELVFRLACRGGRDDQEPAEFPYALPSAALGYLFRHGHGGTAELCNKPVMLIRRKGFRGTIDLKRPLMRPGPYLKFLIIPHNPVFPLLRAMGNNVATSMPYLSILSKLVD